MQRQNDNRATREFGGNKTDEFHPRPHPKSVRLAPLGCPSGEIGRRAWDDLRVAP